MARSAVLWSSVSIKTVLGAPSARRTRYDCGFRFSTKAAGEETKSSREAHRNCRGEERILITGISCRLPSANTMEEFQDKLIAGIDMISQQSRRWNSKRLPARFGFLEDYDKFDAEFFHVVPKLAECMDPQQRKLLEVAFEAVIDAGLNPHDLRGTRTGVYVGALGGEAIEYNAINGLSQNYLMCQAMALPGFMLANRISFALDLKGTSLQANSGCSASLLALEEAVSAIKRGTCEAAIVAGSTIILSPDFTEAFMAMNALSPDGACKTFDEAANGFVRSEAVVAILIQKERAAKRHYATILHVESNADGYKAEGIMAPSGKGQEALLRSAYARSGIDPASVGYIETHGTGTPAGDPEEVQAIYNVFCRGIRRRSPLILGSVKTNIGHTECAAGLSGLAKVITCIQKGVIPANLHFHEPNRAIKHLFGPYLEVTKRTREWAGGLIGINAFGLGGTNCHVILEPGPTTQTQATQPASLVDVPVIVPFSGRTQQAMHKCIEHAVELGTKHPAVFTLLQRVFRQSIAGHNHRGFGIVSPQLGAKAQVIEVETLDTQQRRPVWYVFSGIGSQWPNMAKDLMRFEVFADSMIESAKTLRYAGVDVDQILRFATGSSGGSTYTNIRHALVAIAAVQIALYDLLTSIGIKADGYIGHSAGEALCGYADGCLSQEETLLVSDARGRAILDGARKGGSMASVGLPLEEAKELCPPETFISCHNGRANVTISGAAEVVGNFLQTLRAKGVLFQEVNSCGFAFHNRKYAGDSPELLEKYMNQICPEPRLRSPKWISTSVPESDWERNPTARHCSAAYFANNLLQPVLFHEATKHIPSNAVVVEVAPTGQLQGLLKESLPHCYHTAPISSSASDKVFFLLRSIGELHNVGLDLDLRPLYPRAVSYPVPADVPYLSPLIRWNHEETWPTSIVTYPKRQGRTTLLLDLNDPSLSYLQGHQLWHKIVFPAMGYLTLAWRGLAEDRGQFMEDFPVTFENVSFERATILRPDAPTTKLRFFMSDGDGDFVIRNDETEAVVATGNIKAAHPTHLCSPVHRFHKAGGTVDNMRFLTKIEAYREFRLRGYHYRSDFQGIESISIDGSTALVRWTNNWTTFLDAVLQIILCSIQTRSMLVPTRIERMTINPLQLLALFCTEDKEHSVIPVMHEKHLQRITCPGVEVYKVTTTVFPSSSQKDLLVYEKCGFSPWMHRTGRGESTNFILWKVTDLVKDNVSAHTISAVEILPNPEQSVAHLLFHGLDKTWRKWVPKVSVVTLSCNAESVPEDIRSHLPVQVLTRDSTCDLLKDVCADMIVLHEASWLGKAGQVARYRDFILCRQRQESHHAEQVVLESRYVLRKISFFLGYDGHHYELYRKMEHCPSYDIIHVPINSSSFSWVTQVQSAIGKYKNGTALKNCRIYLTSQGDPYCGILGLVKCLRQEDDSDMIRAIFDSEGSLKLDFERPDESLSEIIANDLVITVFKGGQKGMYCHLPVKHSPGSLRKSVTHAHVNLLRAGDLGSLDWLESPYNLHTLAEAVKTEKKTKLCRVAYASINFKDVLIASGKLPVDSSFCNQDCILGFEFSGKKSVGTRLMGLVSSKGLATTVKVDHQLLFPVPDSWSLEDAATVPVAYLTAYWALSQRFRLSSGQSILIHCGAGGVGQAAISVALAHNCEVFTSVGSEEKRQHIKERFPQLRDDHIGNSRDCSFEGQFMEVTNGRGVDVVLNSLVGDQLAASVRCLAMDGMFLEIGNWHAFANRAPAAISSLGYAGFQSASLWKVFQNATEPEIRTLRHNFLSGLESGVVKPLPRTVFQADQLEGAFRFMASGKHVGKILIDVGTKIGENGHCGSIYTRESVKTIRALARSYFHPEKAYVVIGGLGGLGLEVANWLVDRGVRHLVLPSRSGVTSGYQSMYIERWRVKDVLVEAPRIDLSNLTNAERFVKSVQSQGRPLGGVFNSTLVLRDNPMLEQTVEDFEAVAAPKVFITKNMDALTRAHCLDLDYFVTFSSVASGLGMTAQSNYGYANSVMERICEARVADGLHGLAIQWGAISDVGFFEKHFFLTQSLTSSTECSSSSAERVLGFRPQSILSCLEVLDNALQQQDVGAIVLSAIMGEKEIEGRKGQGSKVFCSSGLVGAVSKIFGIRNIDRLNPTTKLSELGMDSLIATELRQVFERDYDFSITVREMSSITIADLKCIEERSCPAATASRVEPRGSTECGNQQKQPPPQDLASLFKLHEDLIIKLGPEFCTSTSDTCSADLHPLFVVHGNFAGMRETFVPLASRLECPTFGFQFGKYSEADSLHELAQFYVKELQLLQPNGPYHICGYSGGGTVAFEMAIILQEEYKAEVSNLIFLDGSCDWTVQGTTDTKTISQSLLNSFDFLAGIPEAVKDEFLRNIGTDRENNIERAAALLSRLASTFEGDDGRYALKHSVERFLRHHFRTVNYVPSVKFYGRVTLIRAAANRFFSYDTYSVQKHCLLPVASHTVRGSHTSFLSENYVGETAKILRKVLHLG